jgi:hypothetical protein
MTLAIKRCCVLGSLLAASAVMATPALSDGKHFNDGPVINVSWIRTVDGHFDDYMAWLATTWKRQEEAAKKAGVILSYRVIVAEPRGAQDADIILVTEFKNCAALDGLGGKLDSVSVQVEGSLEKANQNEVDRGKIRTVLGSQTMQEALLK